MGRVRFGQRETSTCIVLLSVFAIRGTLHGVGPFALQTQHDSLLLLQAFLATVAMTTIPLAAVVAQLKRSDEVHARLAAIVESSNDAIVGKTLEGHHQLERGRGASLRLPSREAIGQSITIITRRSSRTSYHRSSTSFGGVGELKRTRRCG